MDFSGIQTIEVPIQKVWAYLADIDKVAACGPGFQSLEELGPEHWKALVAVRIGPIKVKFTMDVTRPVLQKPNLIIVRAHGKAPGSAIQLEGRMRLMMINEERTSMNWAARVAVSGILARVGTQLINNVAEKLTIQFFSCLRSHLQAAEVSTDLSHGAEQE